MKHRIYIVRFTVAFAAFALGLAVFTLAVWLKAGSPPAEPETSSALPAVAIEEVPQAEAVMTEAPQDAAADRPDEIYEKKLGRGLVVPGDDYEIESSMIRFYNEDGSLWYEF